MSSTLFKDVLFNALLFFFVLLVLVLPHLNPPAEDAKAEPPGNVIVHITWPEGDTDIDLWMDGPGEPVPVGFSNKGGVLWNLLRDDLGNRPDATPLNYEDAFTRGIVPGDYTLNVHCWRCPQLPVKVVGEVQISNPSGGKSSMSTIATFNVTLFKVGQERTGIRFRMDAAGKVDPESLSTVFKPLMAGKKQ